MKSVRASLLKGTENITHGKDFQRKELEIIDSAFEIILNEYQAGRVQFKRNTSSKDLEYISSATVKDGTGKPITVPLLFFRSMHDEGHYSTYLYIGDKSEGICRNDSDGRVRNIALSIGLIGHIHSDVERELSQDLNMFTKDIKDKYNRSIVYSKDTNSNLGSLREELGRGFLFFKRENLLATFSTKDAIMPSVKLIEVKLHDHSIRNDLAQYLDLFSKRTRIEIKYL